MTYVIVGAGPAGVVAAETLKEGDPSCDVLLIGGEPEPPYSRMAIPYYLIDDIEESGTYLRKSSDHFSNKGIEVRQNRVTGVDPSGHTVTLDNGESLTYDRLE